MRPSPHSIPVIALITGLLWHVPLPSSASWTLEVVVGQAPGRVLETEGLALDSLGRPWIVYAMSSSGNFTTAIRKRTEAGWDSGYSNPPYAGDTEVAFALGGPADTIPHIAYCDQGLLLRHSWMTATGWETELVDTPLYPPSHVSLAIGPEDVLHVAWSTGFDIWYAAKTNTAWVVEHVAAAQITDLSIAVDSAGIPHVAYANDDYHMAHAARRSGSWDVETVDPATATMDPSLALGADGAAYLAYIYQDTTGGWNSPVLRQASNEPGSWYAQTLDSIDCSAPSLVLDSSERPHIACLWGSQSSLKYYRTLALPSETVDASHANFWAPHLALDGSDRAHIGYGVSDRYYGIMYAREDVNTDVSEEVERFRDAVFFAFPNPFLSATTLRLRTAGPTVVPQVQVYDILGRMRRVISFSQDNSTQHCGQWDGRDDYGEPVAPGVYFLRTRSCEGTQTAKVLRVR